MPMSKRVHTAALSPIQEVADGCIDGGDCPNKIDFNGAPGDIKLPMADLLHKSDPALAKTMSWPWRESASS